jgi:hypothetical protein
MRPSSSTLDYVIRWRQRGGGRRGDVPVLLGPEMSLRTSPASSWPKEVGMKIVQEPELDPSSTGWSGHL